MTMLIIRRATTSDVPRLLPLMVQYRHFYKLPARSRDTAGFFAKRVGTGEAIVLMAESGARRALAAFALIYPGFSSLRLGRVWTLNDLYVAPRFRGQGVARRLLRQIARAAARDGILVVSLSTAHTNRHAQALYESEGYVRDVEFAHYDFTPKRSSGHHSAAARTKAARAADASLTVATSSPTPATRAPSRTSSRPATVTRRARRPAAP